MLTEQFSIRVKIGEKEVEIAGSKDEVIKTLDDLPEIVRKISAALSISIASPISFPSLSKTGAKVPAEVKFPSISGASSISDAVVKLLSTEWGKKPRTGKDLFEAMKANAIHHSWKGVLGTLTRLTKSGKIRRWRLNQEYVYTLQ